MANNLLTAAQVFSTIGSVLAALLILLVMITIHEFGHYMAGKLLRFKIEEFSIGFGPALFKRRSKKTGELFAVRLIPLGGYCAFAGEDGVEEETKETKEDAPFEELKETELMPEPSAPPEDRSGWFTNRPCWQRIIVLVAGAFMNYLLALVLILIGVFSYGQSMIAVYDMDVREEYVGVSLQAKDIFLKADGKNLYLTTDIAKALNGKHAGDTVKFTVSRIISEEGEREIMEVPVMLRSDVSVRNSADLDSAWAALGIKYSEEDGGYLLASASVRFGFWESIGRSFAYSFKIAGSILKVLGELLTGRIGINSFGGPVTTITMTSQMVSRGFRYFLEIAGYIGVNLAVFNLLPIPALDGCKIVFTVIEWIRGKPISRKVEAIINVIGLVFLLGFAVLVDILQFVI